MSIPAVIDVVVIGAGLSGLCAACRLKENGLNVFVLEARDRVGGRTYTIQCPDYGWMDMGASYAGCTQRNLLALAKEFDIETYEACGEGDFIFYHKGKPLRYKSTESWPHNNPLTWLDCNNTFRLLDKMAAQVPANRPWEARQANEWDRITVQQWIDNTCWTSAAREWMRQFVHSNVTSEPWEVSLLWLLWYISSAGSVYDIWECEGAAQEYQFVGGTQQISIKLAEKLGTGRVIYNSVVTEIRQDIDGATVHTSKGDTYRCKCVIVATPPWLQGAIQYTPSLPARKIQLLQRMPMGSCIKSQTLYKHPFWKDAGLNGITSTADGVTIVGNTMGDNRPDGNGALITGFIMASMARTAGELTKDQRRQHTLDCHYRFFGDKQAYQVLHYEDFNWMEEPYTGGCYTNVCPPGVLTRFGSALHTPHGRVYFAGSETSVRWSGYMEGAIVAGKRAAGEVLYSMEIISQEEIQHQEADDDKTDSPDNGSWWADNAPSVGGFLFGVSLVSICVTGGALWYKYGDHNMSITLPTWK